MIRNDKYDRVLGDYILGPRLGKGKFGCVRYAKKSGDSTYKYAVKYMKIGQPFDKATLVKALQEEYSLTELSHPNVLRLYDAKAEGVYEKIPYPKKKVESESEGPIHEKEGDTSPMVTGADPGIPKSPKTPVVYAVLQLARQGDLFDFLTSFGSLSERTARWFFIQILDALEYIHGEGIAHRDLKPENLLLDLEYNALLSDFGLCKKLIEIGPHGKIEERVGTDRYMSPELYANKAYSPVQADLFALGVILFMLVACHPPFTCASSKESDHYRLIRTHKINEYWAEIGKLHSPNWCSSELMHLLTAMFQFEPSLRPSIAEIRDHQWVKGELPLKGEIVKEFEARQAKAIENRKLEAKKRKADKEAAEKALKASPTEKQNAKPFGPHKVRKGVEFSDKSGPIPTIKKMIKEYGLFISNKPTVLFSAYPPEDVEGDLLAFFQTTKKITCFPNSYKVSKTLTS